MGGSPRKRLGAGACALALALGWAAAAGALTLPKPVKPATERGVVQSVSADELMLKTLDGRTVAVVVDARTRILVEGKPASILDVHPGFVAVVSFRGASGQAAAEIDAFTTSPSLTPIAGLVRSNSRSELVLKSLDGTTVHFRINAATRRVLVDGKPASILGVRPGFVVVVRPGTATGTGKGTAQKTVEAREVFAFAPSRQPGAHLYSGAVASVPVHAIVLRSRSGGTFRLALPANTRVFLDGKPTSLDAVEPGDIAVVRTGPRREVWAYRRAG